MPAAKSAAPVLVKRNSGIYGYERALEVLDSLGVRELAVFERRERRLEPIG